MWHVLFMACGVRGKKYRLKSFVVNVTVDDHFSVFRLFLSNCDSTLAAIQKDDAIQLAVGVHNNILSGLIYRWSCGKSTRWLQHASLKVLPLCLALVVSICVIIDQVVKDGSIGYGE